MISSSMCQRHNLFCILAKSQEIKSKSYSSHQICLFYTGEASEYCLPYKRDFKFQEFFIKGVCLFVAG